MDHDQQMSLKRKHDQEDVANYVKKNCCDASTTVEPQNNNTTITPYWSHIPGYISHTWFEDLYHELIPLVTSYGGVINGKEFIFKRLSCKFLDKQKNTDLQTSSKHIPDVFSYDKIKQCEWNESKTLLSIKDKLEKDFNHQYDYCLAHIYRDGRDTINWHSDRESLDTPVASISLGATRKFRFRKKQETKGWETELSLGSGDLVYMHHGCQRAYMHTVPVETKVKHPRINLTFRQFSLHPQQ